MKEKEQSETMVVKAAKVIGKVVGKVAAAAGVHGEENPSPANSRLKGKLVKKNKSRLPRRVKKARKQFTSRRDAA